jgi:signal transduction histidine kinase
MGRLYWKFFLFFFLAQLTTAFGVGVYILLDVNNRNPTIDQSPIGQSFIDATESTLRLGGIHATKVLLEKWEAQHLRHRVYVVDDSKQDILNRKLETAWISSAHASIQSGSANNVMQVNLADQQSYLVFVVTTFPNKQHGVAPPPPRFEGDKPPTHAFGGGHPMFRILATFPIKGLLIGTLASSLFAAILAWYFSKPIKTLRRAFEHAAEGNLNTSVADKMGSRKDELSDLGKHFDHMAGRLGALMQGQTRLLHHVSHELRSPLARMHMALGLAVQNPNRAENSLSRIELEANRMDKMIGELLELSRFESGMVELHKETFLLNDVLQTIVEDAAFEASNKRMRIALHCNTLITLLGQQDLMHRAIENVVRNAIKYAPNDSVVTIDVHLQEASSHLNIVITDQGEGVLEAELDDIFKPFVRGHSGSQVVGHGVGLAITKQVLEAHGGKVSAKNLKPYGFSVSMTMPI